MRVSVLSKAWTEQASSRLRRIGLRGEALGRNPRQRALRRTDGIFLKETLQARTGDQHFLAVFGARQCMELAKFEFAFAGSASKNIIGAMIAVAASGRMAIRTHQLNTQHQRLF